MVYFLFLNKLHLNLSTVMQNVICSHLVKVSLKANIYSPCRFCGSNCNDVTVKTLGNEMSLFLNDV